MSILFMLALVLAILMGYLFGSICSAIIVSNMFSLPNPCLEGSQNPGATNMLRLAGKKFAALVLCCDMLKGVIPVLIAHLFTLSHTIIGFTALAAVVGHIYPVFFKFKGGKGVATALGALLAINPMLGIITAATWILVAAYFRYSSLASMASLTIAPLYAISITQSFTIFPPVVFITFFILYQHRDNISRLISGTEHKIRFKRNQLSDIADELIDKKQAELIPEMSAASTVLSSTDSTPIHNDIHHSTTGPAYADGNFSPINSPEKTVAKPEDNA